MKKLVAALSILFFTLGFSQPDYPAFRVADGPTSAEFAHKWKNDGYVRLKLIHPVSGDTLDTFLTHATKHEITTDVPEDADAVAWCYPQRHPDPRHLAGGKEGTIDLNYKAEQKILYIR
jgi:hypothetical protein